MSARLSILFVDDDAAVLTALRRTMRESRGMWDVSYALGGREALEVLAAQPVDVICTDMLMPKMSGIQLLNIVRQFYPQIVRVILSATESDQIMKLAGSVVHAVLCKTSAFDQLSERIMQAVDEKNAGDVKKLAQRLQEITVMPISSQTVFLLNEMYEAKSPAVDIAECITTDGCMTANLIKAMNHPDFGLPRKVDNLLDGILWSGVEKVKTVISGLPVFSPEGTGDDAVPASFTKELWAHCALTGKFARKIAEKMRMPREQQLRAQVAGVMHDIGKVFIVNDHWRIYKDVIERCQKEKESLNKLEQQMLGLSHAEIGGRMLERWNLAAEVSDVIRFHHTPRLSMQQKTFGVLAAVHIADAVASEAMGLPSPFNALVDMEYLYEIGVHSEYAGLRMNCLGMYP